jgi:integrase/recombinase XerD
VTKAFVTQRHRERLAQASLVRIYATVRHFARWLHRKFPTLFPLGCPTDGVKPPAEPTATWKGLTRRDEVRLLGAAQRLRLHPGTGTDQGLRNHALLAVLLGSGLRVSEILQLDRDQYTGKSFTKVMVKGGFVRNVVPMHRDARQVLDAWRDQRKDEAPPLFCTRTGRRLSRREAAAIIRRIAAQANAHRPEEARIDVSPHVLRHTFLRKLAETKGVQYAKEASGHQSDRYIWRYVQPDRQTLAEAIDALE